jgi:hypothetical protein
MEFFSSNPALTIGSSFPFTVGPHANETSAPRGQFREILYATDFSPESLDAAAYAVSLAQEFQSRLVLLHVIQRRRAGDLVSITELRRVLTKNFCARSFHRRPKPGANRNTTW